MIQHFKTIQALCGLVFLSLMMACHPDNKQPMGVTPTDDTTRDMHTYAKPDARIKHLSLDLSVDFVTKQLSGTATYDIEVKDNADSIFFDTRNLEIGKIYVDDQDTPYHLGAAQEFLGQPLAVPVNKDSKKIKIHYATSPTGAEALQWLEPSQTAGKKEPYLFTQGQAILTRTWIPIQDSPGIRITYDAVIHTPKQLMAVMSATNPQSKNTEGVYNFKMVTTYSGLPHCTRGG
jgi:aminopeptidase N